MRKQTINTTLIFLTAAAVGFILPRAYMVPRDPAAFGIIMDPDSGQAVHLAGKLCAVDDGLDSELENKLLAWCMSTNDPVILGDKVIRD